MRRQSRSNAATITVETDSVVSSSSAAQVFGDDSVLSAQEGLSKDCCKLAKAILPYQIQ